MGHASRFRDPEQRAPGPGAYTREDEGYEWYKRTYNLRY